MNNESNQSNKPNCPGPTTEAGKAISSKNALRHGCCALDTLLLPGESAEDLKALEASFTKAYNPQSDHERHLVQDLANADWLLQRVIRAHAQVEAKLYAETPDRSEWSEAQERQLGRHVRYKTAQTNCLAKARKAVEDYRKTRLAEKVTEEKQHIARERLEIFRQKNRPEPTWKEHLENMRRQAIAMGITPPER